jgi:hypothetical protein
MSQQIPSELLKLWTLAIQGDNPSGRSEADDHLKRLRALYRDNRDAFSHSDLKVIDVAKVLLGMKERISPQFLPQ